MKRFLNKILGHLSLKKLYIRFSKGSFWVFRRLVPTYRETAVIANGRATLQTLNRRPGHKQKANHFGNE
ncbi:MAG: hypothetical protein IT232_09590 [Flavobacteriales bacterium]|nr:hypothetical protein [Flavobacteriales bacterium]